VMMCVYFVAMHNNSLLLLLLGLPFDRALPWHKLLALSAVVNSILHGLSYYAGGRAKSMPDTRNDPYHMLPHVKAPLGMEVSGAPSCSAV
jgi:Ferric reductase like transmembrane component